MSLIAPVYRSANTSPVRPNGFIPLFRYYFCSESVPTPIAWSIALGCTTSLLITIVCRGVLFYSCPKCDLPSCPPVRTCPECPAFEGPLILPYEDQLICHPGWFLKDGMCSYASYEELVYHDAFDYCRSWGSTLAYRGVSFHVPYSFLSVSIWTGKCNLTVNHVLASDNVTINDNTTDITDMTDKMMTVQYESCQVKTIDEKYEDSERWVSPDDIYPFVCIKAPSRVTKCPVGWCKQENRDGCLFLGLKNITFAEAQTFCSSMKAELPRPLDRIVSDQCENRNEATFWTNVCRKKRGDGTEEWYYPNGHVLKIPPVDYIDSPARISCLAYNCYTKSYRLEVKPVNFLCLTY